MLAVFMHYCEREVREKDVQMTYVEKAETYIGTNYSYPITVEDVAAYVGISGVIFSVLFRRICGNHPRNISRNTGSSRPAICSRRQTCLSLR